jgi:hypothetical protein
VKEKSQGKIGAERALVKITNLLVGCSLISPIIYRVQSPSKPGSATKMLKHRFPKEYWDWNKPLEKEKITSVT